MKLTNRSSTTEAQEQMAIMRWLDLKGIPAFHIPNGGKRNLIEAVKFKKLGVKPGIPDIFLPIPRKSYHGLFIELKKDKKAYLTEKQQFWVEELSRQGYLVHVAYGAEQAIRYISNYIDLTADTNYC
jgi:hypothetical protein